MSETTEPLGVARDVAALQNDLDEPLTISFPPIAGPAGEVSSFIIREPTALQMAEWDKLEGEAAKMKAISICGAVPLVVVQQLKARAYLRAIRRIEAFLA